MLTARRPGPWPGLIAVLALAGAPGPVPAGRAEEGAPPASPLRLAAPVEVVEAGRGVDLPSQLLWSDPERIHLLGLLPQDLLAIAPGTGIVERLAVQGGGPFDIQGPVASLAAGARPTEVVVVQPGRLRTLVFGRHGPVARSAHERPVTGCVSDAGGAWWLAPVPWDPAAGTAGRVELLRGAAPGTGNVALAGPAAWTGRHSGGAEEVLTAQYFTRLLPGPGGRLWRVVLGMNGQAELVDPARGTARRLEVDPVEGAWIEASVDGRGRLHLLVAGGPGSLGRRVLRFGPGPLSALEGDRDWNTGAVAPDGRRWAAVDAETGAVLVYPVTRDPSNR